MVNVTTIYPADPLGTIPGGIDTLIKDIIQCAPKDFRYALIGATTDPQKRPVQRWTKCALGDAEFDFFPVYAIKNPGKQPRFPATVRHLLPLLWGRPDRATDILESHRIEPFFAYLKHPAPRFAFIHQDMCNLRSSGSDIRWKYAPRLYSRVEDYLIRDFAGLFCVHEAAAEQYKIRFPKLADRIHFMPTWTNPEIFFAVSDEKRKKLRLKMASRFEIDSSARILLSVGRIDRQKNPLRLIHAVNQLIKQGLSMHVIFVGDGTLRNKCEIEADALEIRGNVSFAGILPSHEVADYLRASDSLVLSSDYEGMPVCAIEALACGIPVISTPVGEIGRIVNDGVNGRIASGFETENLADAINDCMQNLDRYFGQPCINVAERYTPHSVLSPIFNAYRKSIS